MSTANVIKGGCLCQSVQYQVTGAPKMTLVCHCDNCRKVTGSTFMANALYQKDVSSPTQSSELSNSLMLTGLATAYYIGRGCPQSLRRQQHGVRKHHLSKFLLQLRLTIAYQRSLGSVRCRSDRHYVRNDGFGAFKRELGAPG